MALLAAAEAIAFLTEIAATGGDVPPREAGEAAVVHAEITSTGGLSRTMALKCKRIFDEWIKAAQRYN